MSRKPAIGGYATSYCTRCRLDLGHTIMVMEGEKVVRVKCRTCGSEHNYKDKTKKEKSVKKAQTRAVKKTATPKGIERKWEAALEQAHASPVPYSSDKSFAVGDIVSHEKFGMGIVQSAVTKKVTILFRDKERLLVSAN